jgi:TIR domain
MPISVFLSYSHKDRRVAGALKRGLEHFGLEAFLAHEDLAPSSNWLRTIRKNLRDCHVFMPLLTKAFKQSDWTDQETGFAVSLKKIVLPIKVDLLPYGFITEVHAQKMPTHINAGACWRIIKHLSKHETLKDGLVDDFIGICARSKSFVKAQSNFEYLVELAPFSSDQLGDIFEAAARNRQVYESFGARRVLERLMRDHAAEIPTGPLSRYKKQLED